MSLLNNSLTSAYTLHCLALKNWGSEYLNWEPETLEMELGEDVPKINLEKLLGVSVILTTDQFYNFWEPFESISNVLNMELPQFELVTPLTVDKACWAIVEAELLDGEMSYSSEVIAYLETLLHQENAEKVPSYLKKIGVKIPFEGYDSEYLRDIDRYIMKRRSLIEQELKIAFGKKVTLPS